MKPVSVDGLQEALDLQLSSWRNKSSQYIMRIGWCHEWESDPISGLVEEVVNFLAHFFSEGYQYCFLNAYNTEFWEEDLCHIFPVWTASTEQHGQRQNPLVFVWSLWLTGSQILLVKLNLIIISIDTQH